MSEPEHVHAIRLTRDSLYERGTPQVTSGSLAEATALARIEELREQELERLNDTFAARRRRARKYWRNRR